MKDLLNVHLRVVPDHLLHLTSVKCTLELILERDLIPARRKAVAEPLLQQQTIKITYVYIQVQYVFFSFYALTSKDRGHIVLTVSICLPVQNFTLKLNIFLLLQNYLSRKSRVWYVLEYHWCASNKGHLSKVKVKFLPHSLNTQINRAFSKIVLFGALCIVFHKHIVLLH